METGIIEPVADMRLTLIPAPDDPPLSSEEYQKVLLDFSHALKSQGLEFSSPWFTHDAVGVSGGFKGEFIFATVATLAAAINQVRKLIETVLDARDGRKLKLQIGSFRLEGGARDVEKMFERLVSSEPFRKLLGSQALKKSTRRPSSK